MNHYLSYNLSKTNIENFSLLKEKKNKIFGNYKTKRYQYNNQDNKINFINLICRSDLIISKAIDFHFINPIQKDKNLNKKENSFDINNNNKFIKNNKIKKELIKNKNKYCKNKVNKSLDNKNILIKPIMFEDTLLNKKCFTKKNEVPPRINIHNNNFIFGNPYSNYCLNNSFFNNLNNFKYNNFIKKENYFTNSINLKFNKSFEKKLIAPKIVFSEVEDIKNKNISTNEQKEQKELDKLNINNYLLINKDKKDNIDINNISPKNSIDQKSISNNKSKNIYFLKKINKQKGRKAKNAKNLNIESKHTKHSSDNMMRKIKNKVIESSRLLANKIIKDEIKNNPNIKFNLINREFRKIQGSFSQELNIKYNFWFYKIKIKDIFSMEISNKYTAIKKSSNNELINYLFSPLNNNNFIKAKQLLNTPFHQFYHDIFLNENKNWKAYYGINENDNKYQIDNMLKTIQEEEDEINDKNIKYINDIKELAHNYENYFLDKKPRNVDYNNKKNKYIKELTNNSLNDKYLELCNEIKQLKSFYDNRNLLKDKLPQISLNNQKSDDTLDNSLIKNNNYININNNHKNQFENNITNNNIINNIIPSKDKEPKIEYIINNTISLQEEDKNDNFDENISENRNNNNNNNNKIFKNILKEEVCNNNCDKNKFCNKKRKNDKIKYFISCKNSNCK